MDTPATNHPRSAYRPVPIQPTVLRVDNHREGMCLWVFVLESKAMTDRMEEKKEKNTPDRTDTN